MVQSEDRNAHGRCRVKGAGTRGHDQGRMRLQGEEFHEIEGAEQGVHLGVIRQNRLEGIPFGGGSGEANGHSGLCKVQGHLRKVGWSGIARTAVGSRVNQQEVLSQPLQPLGHIVTGCGGCQGGA